MELSGNIKKFLTAANSKWEDESKRAREEGGFKDLPLDKYICRLADAQLEESASSGRAQIKWVYVVIEGDYTGETIREYQGLDNEDAFFYLAQQFLKYGIEAEGIIYDTKKAKDPMFIVNVLKTMVKEKPVVSVRMTKGKTGDVWPRLAGLVENYEGAEDLPPDNEPEAEPEAAPKNKGGRPKGSTSAATTTASTAGNAKKAEPEPEPEEEPEAEEEEPEAEAEEDKVELEVGMKIEFTYRGETKQGEIKEVLDDDKLKVSSNKLVYTIGLDKVTDTVS